MIWSGYGYVVFIIVFICSLITEVVTRFLTNDDEFYQNHYFPISLALMISGIMVFLFQKYFDNLKAKNKDTYFIQKATIADLNNTLFFIPLKYWSYILMAIAIAIGYLHN